MERSEPDARNKATEMAKLLPKAPKIQMSRKTLNNVLLAIATDQG